MMEVQKKLIEFRGKQKEGNKVNFIESIFVVILAILISIVFLPQAGSNELQGGNANLHYAIGAKLYEHGFYDLAEAEFKKSLQIKPDYTDSLLALAFLYEDLRKLERAMILWAEYLRVCDKNDSFYSTAITHMSSLKKCLHYLPLDKYDLHDLYIKIILEKNQDFLDIQKGGTNNDH